MNLEALVERYEENIGQASEWLEARGLTVQDAMAYRLGVVMDDGPESAPYRGRLAIPYLTPAGVVDVRFRALDDSEPKYLSRAGAKPHLFNVAALWRASTTIAICEGELDALVMDLHGPVPAVGVAGVQAWKAHYRRLFADYDRVLVIGDGDQVGREFATRVAGMMDNAVAVSPQSGDVNDLFLAHGAGALAALVGAR